MKGQWIGNTIGDIEGQLILNIDDVGNNYAGVAQLLPFDKKLPSSIGFFQTVGLRDVVTF